MQGELWLISYFLLFFLTVGGGGTALLWLVWRIQTRDCPNCYQRIPKSLIERGLPCPVCGSILGEGQTLGSEVAESNCTVCNTSLGDCELLALWDGRHYCRNCLQATGLETTGAVDTGLVLSEDVPDSAISVAGRASILYLLLMSGFAGLIAILAGIFNGLLAALNVFGVLMLLSSPVVLLFTYASWLAMTMIRPRTTAWNGQLIIQSGPTVMVAPLAECYWAEGKASQTNVMKIGFFFRGNAIVVEVPARYARDGNRIAVGFTPETYELWKAFLTLARVPTISSKPNWWKRWRGSNTLPQST